eukprot:TRINITY_DN2251_c1_g1_i2.p1 TRINITY_DN2251_c1_g1~~TRINITY_DN2251_c1_g1_i2.p1  ORF type:complete len:215 (-),score=41.49 TRINITY_DN2251_c1_g1_i2:191-835(-)
MTNIFERYLYLELIYQELIDGIIELLHIMKRKAENIESQPEPTTQQVQRLKELISKYGSDLDKYYEEYVTVATSKNLPVLARDDPNLYFYRGTYHVQYVSQLIDSIKYELNNKEKYPDWSPPTKKRKVDVNAKKCSCGGLLFEAISRACDGNYYKLPFDTDFRSGYMISIPGLSDSDGLSLSMCIECGKIQDFVLENLREIIQNESNEGALDMW